MNDEYYDERYSDMEQSEISALRRDALIDAISDQLDQITERATDAIGELYQTALEGEEYRIAWLKLEAIRDLVNDIMNKSPFKGA